MTIMSSNKQINIILIITLICIIIPQQVYSKSYQPSDFVNSIFNFSGLKEGLYEINITDDSNDLQDETIMAYGHYNRYDQYAGIITRDKSLKKLNLYLWDSSNKQYTKMNQFCSSGSSDCSKDIDNVIPVDWDYNGYLDLIIIAKDSEGLETKSFQAHFLLQYVQDITSAECNLDSCQLVNIVSARLDSNTQPFIIPYQDLKKNPDYHMHGLFYVKNQGELRRVVLISDPTSYQKVIEIDFLTLVEQNNSNCKQQYDINEINQRQLAAVHYSAVLDFNGDCRNDLFIHSQKFNDQTQLEDSFEFYSRLQNGNYCLVNVQTIPNSHRVQSIGFSDINFDGGIDMIIVYKVVGLAQKSVMQIAFNHHIPTDKNLCPDDFIYQSVYGDLTNLTDTTKDMLIVEYDFVLYKMLQLGIYPSLRFGDFNLDGYNDLLMTIVDENNPNDAKSYFFENSECTLKQCDGLQLRQFVQQTNSKYDIISESKSFSASFFDFNENGQLDIILNTYSYNVDTPDQVQLSTKSIYNYLKTDSYFVKAFVMNGALDGTADNDYTSSNIYGATVVCKVTTIEEDIRPIKGIQLYQSAFIPLQLPYVIMGIARTNSYIENLSVGLGYQGGNSVKLWNPIIPNTQINVYPQSNNIESWNVNAFMVNVVESLLAILIMAACILIAVGITIFYLFTREKAQDKREIEVVNLLI